MFQQPGESKKIKTKAASCFQEFLVFGISDETLALALEIVHGTYRTRKDLHRINNKNKQKILQNTYEFHSPSDKESLPDSRGSREIQLITQSRREQEVVQV